MGKENMFIVTTHSSGVNWGQALATGLSLLGGMVALLSIVFNRVDTYRSRNVTQLNKTVNEITNPIIETLKTVSLTLERMADRLDEQGERLARVEGSAIRNDKDARTRRGRS